MPPPYLVTPLPLPALSQLSYIRKKLPWREWQDKKLKLDEVKAELKAVRQEYQVSGPLLPPGRRTTIMLCADN